MNITTFTFDQIIGSIFFVISIMTLLYSFKKKRFNPISLDLHNWLQEIEKIEHDADTYLIEVSGKFDTLNDKIKHKIPSQYHDLLPSTWDRTEKLIDELKITYGKLENNAHYDHVIRQTAVLKKISEIIIKNESQKLRTKNDISV